MRNGDLLVRAVLTLLTVPGCVIAAEHEDSSASTARLGDSGGIRGHGSRSAEPEHRRNGAYARTRFSEGRLMSGAASDAGSAAIRPHTPQHRPRRARLQHAPPALAGAP